MGRRTPMRIPIPGLHNLLLDHHDLKPDSDFLPKNGHVGWVKSHLLEVPPFLSPKFSKTASWTLRFPIPGLDILAGSEAMPESPISEVPSVLSTSFSKTASWTLRLHLPGLVMLAGSEKMPESHLSEVPPVLRTSFKGQFLDSQTSYLDWTCWLGQRRCRSPCQRCHRS
jgi:hypothetical protein